MPGSCAFSSVHCGSNRGIALRASFTICSYNRSSRFGNGSNRYTSLLKCIYHDMMLAVDNDSVGDHRKPVDIQLCPHTVFQLVNTHVQFFNMVHRRNGLQQCVKYREMYLLTDFP